MFYREKFNLAFRVQSFYFGIEEESQHIVIPEYLELG